MPDSNVDEFEFQLEHDGTLSLDAAVHQAMGAASVCWEDMSGTGVFQEQRARKIASALLNKILSEEGPCLGLATTEQLLDEIRSRIEVDYWAGGGGLQYTTVTGRPEAVLKGDDASTTGS